MDRKKQGQWAERFAGGTVVEVLAGGGRQSVGFDHVASGGAAWERRQIGML